MPRPRKYPEELLDPVCGSCWSRAGRWRMSRVIRDHAGAAKSYLRSGHSSPQRLIHQLESPYGDQLQIPGCLGWHDNATRIRPVTMPRRLSL